MVTSSWPIVRSSRDSVSTLAVSVVADVTRLTMLAVERVAVGRERRQQKATSAAETASVRISQRARRIASM